MNSYIIKTYLAYGRPDKAAAMYESVKGLLDRNTLVTVLNAMMDGAASRRDRPAMERALADLTAVYTGEDHNPIDLYQLMFARARLVQLAHDLKDHAGALALARDDLSSFHELVRAEHLSPFFDRLGEADAGEYRKLYFLCYYPRATFQHHFLAALSRIALGEREGILSDLERVVSELAAARFDLERSVGVSGRYMQLSGMGTGYDLLSRLAAELGDRGRTEAFAAKAKEAGAAYQAFMEEQRKRSQRN